MPQERSPQYGFSNTYQPSPQAQALGTVIEALRNPKNYYSTIDTPMGPQPMILGPGLMGTLESGGARVPFNDIRRIFGIPRENRYKYNPPADVEQEIRRRHLENITALNEGANTIRNPENPIVGAMAQQLFRAQPPNEQDLFRRTIAGQLALEQEKLRQMRPSTGGHEPIFGPWRGKPRP